MKYVSRSFVHPHPDFDRPKVPIPPPRIQSTLLRAVATSPKLAGRLNRPMSMTTGIESPSASPLPTHSPSLHQLTEENTAPFGGLNLRPESMALLEENWKKLEKNGRLQQWNLKSMYNVVKSPRKSFNLSKFARPGSFRRKKSPLVTDDYPHSDNELDDPIPPPLYRVGQSQSQSVSPNLAYAPRKPPRTYTTTVRQIESTRTSDSLFNSDGDDFSSDLLSTLDRLGSVYSISALLGEELDGNHDDEDGSFTPHRKLVRSVSAQIESQQATIPKISVFPNNSDNSERIIEEDDESTSTTLLSIAQKEVSRSLTCLQSNATTSLTVPGSSHDNEEEVLVLNYDQEPTNYTDDIRDRTLRNIDLSQFIGDDDSSIDSYQSAEDRDDLLEDGDNLLPSEGHHSESPIEIKRPDSEASELFHTPPNSISPCPSGLESISPSHVTNIGLALGVNISLEDTQATTNSGKSPSTACQSNLGDLTNIGGELRDVKDDDEDMEDFGDESIHISPDKSVLEEKEENTEPATPKEEPNTAIMEDSSSSKNNTPPSESVSTDVMLPSLNESPSMDTADFEDDKETSSSAVFNEEEGEDPYSEYDIHIIPDEITPSKVSYMYMYMYFFYI